MLTPSAPEIRASPLSHTPSACIVPPFFGAHFASLENRPLQSIEKTTWDSISRYSRTIKPSSPKLAKPSSKLQRSMASSCRRVAAMEHADCARAMCCKVRWITARQRNLPCPRRKEMWASRCSVAPHPNPIWSSNPVTGACWTGVHRWTEPFFMDQRSLTLLIFRINRV